MKISRAIRGPAKNSKKPISTCQKRKQKKKKFAEKSLGNFLSIIGTCVSLRFLIIEMPLGSFFFFASTESDCEYIFCQTKSKQQSAEWKLKENYENENLTWGHKSSAGSHKKNTQWILSTAFGTMMRASISLLLIILISCDSSSHCWDTAMMKNCEKHIGLKAKLREKSFWRRWMSNQRQAEGRGRKRTRTKGERRGSIQVEWKETLSWGVYKNKLCTVHDLDLWTSTTHPRFLAFTSLLSFFHFYRQEKKFFSPSHRQRLRLARSTTNTKAINISKLLFPLSSSSTYPSGSEMKSTKTVGKKKRVCWSHFELSRQWLWIGVERPSFPPRCVCVVEFI